MASYSLEIGPHPAQARHPLTGKPLTDDDGKPVPLITDQMTVRLDGEVIAYISKAGVSFLMSKQQIGAVIYEESVALAGTVYGEPERVVTIETIEKPDPEPTETILILPDDE